MKNKNYLYLIIWIISIITVGSAIGSLTKSQINTWYSTLDRSELTPPNYIFPIAWTILYGFIGSSGWLIWSSSSFSRLNFIKILYIIQLILNWIWTPLFFHYHQIMLSLITLVFMDALVLMITWLSYRRLRLVSIIMVPYLLWILFASYLNFYIWQHN